MSPSLIPLYERERTPRYGYRWKTSNMNGFFFASYQVVCLLNAIVRESGGHALRGRIQQIDRQASGVGDDHDIFGIQPT